MPRQLSTRLVGSTFGRLTVMARAGSKWIGRKREIRALWLCQCECGGTCIRDRHELRYHKLPSCGCSYSGERHGKRHTPEYLIWLQIKNACNNPNDIRWHICGARGVRVCLPWSRSFLTFLASVGRRPSRKHELRRLDMTKDYAPGNVVWRLRSGEIKNPKLAQLVTMGGETKTLLAWGLALGIPRQRLLRRLGYDWSVGDILRAELMTRTPAIIVDEILRRHRDGESAGALGRAFHLRRDTVLSFVRADLQASAKIIEKAVDIPEGVPYNAPRPTNAEGSR